MFMDFGFKYLAPEKRLKIFSFKKMHNFAIEHFPIIFVIEVV